MTDTIIHIKDSLQAIHLQLDFDSTRVILLQSKPDNSWQFNLTHIITIFFGLCTLTLGIATFLLGRKISLKAHIKQEQLMFVKKLMAAMQSGFVIIKEKKEGHSITSEVSFNYLITNDFRIDHPEWFDDDTVLTVAQEFHNMEFLQFGLTFGLPPAIKTALFKFWNVYIYLDTQIDYENRRVLEMQPKGKGDKKATNFYTFSNFATFAEFHFLLMDVVAKIDKWLDKNGASDYTFRHEKKIQLDLK